MYCYMFYIILILSATFLLADKEETGRTEVKYVAYVVCITGTLSWFTFISKLLDFKKKLKQSFALA